MTSALRFGLWYDFRNPSRWRQDPTTLYRSILAQVERAEELGWDDVWLSEHHFIEDDYTPSVLPLAAAIAARTTRMRIGTAALLLPLHDPLRVAEDAATVDVLSGGRLDLGVALGYKLSEFKGFGVSTSSRVGRLEEGLGILRALFAGKTLNHNGRYYHYEDVSLRPLPVQRPLPLWVGGFVEVAARRAARLADGLIVNGGVGWVIDAYRDELQRLGQDPAEHEVASGFQWLVVARDPEKRWREARDHFIYQLGHYMTWAAEPSGHSAPAITRDEQLRQAGFHVMSPERAVELIRPYVKQYRLNRFYSWTLPPGLPPEWSDEHIELMAKEVIPAFRPSPGT